MNQPARRLRELDRPPLALHDRAMDNLRFIRETMERSASFTHVSGSGGVLMGVTAVMATAVAVRVTGTTLWLVTWVVAAIISLAIAVFMMAKKSRLAMTSGAVAPVLDGGGGRYSVFAKALIDALRSNSEVIDGRTLHQLVAQSVSYAAQEVRFEQLPQYSPIKFSGHEAGDFFFVPQVES